MTERLGVVGVKKTCSMALGDTGITPLEHTGAYATFANGGKLAKPYAILEIFNSKGEVIYAREQDEPPAPPGHRPRVAEQMNQMMQLVVTEGTGKRAALDFTHAAGKTGTSSSYRDAWFMGFTGIVTGVWLGNDDYPDMTTITGGSLPAMAWTLHVGRPHQHGHSDDPRPDAASGPGGGKAAAGRTRRLEPASASAGAKVGRAATPASCRSRRAKP